MVAKENLYIMDIGKFTKDLYRMGNARWPNFSEGRARVDVVIRNHNGIEMVISNGNGFSAFDHLTKIMAQPVKKYGRLKKVRFCRLVSDS